MTLERFWATAAVMPRAVELVPVLACASAGVVVVGLVSGPSNAPWHGRLAGMVVTVACAGLLDDTASSSLAASPTPLAARRGMRVALVGAGLGLWWSAMLVLMSLRTEGLPAVAMTRELGVLAAMSVLGALVVQRHNRDGKGAIGGVLAVGWFALSFVPRPEWMPMPPNSLDPRAAGALTAILLCTLAAIAMLSRDPASKHSINS